MLYPRGICLFPPLPPISSFHKASLYIGSSFKIASRRQWGEGEWGGGNGEGGMGRGEWGSGGRRGEVPLSARRFIAPFPDQETWFQASTKRERPAISLDCT